MVYPSGPPSKLPKISATTKVIEASPSATPSPSASNRKAG